MNDFGAKLVRDGIPAIIAADGRWPIVRVLDDREYRRALIDKLGEETAELAAADDPHAVLDEMADLLEVLRALAESTGRSIEDVADRADRKRSERGAFASRLLLVGIDAGSTTADGG